MNKIMKVTISVLLLLCMLISVIPYQVFASEIAREPKTFSQTFINPLYEDLISEEDLDALLPEQTPAAQPNANSSSNFMSEQEGAKELRKQMRNRNPQFTIKIKSASGDSNRVLGNLQALAQEHTGVPTEGDYLASCYLWNHVGGSFSNSAGTYYYTINYTFEYFANAQQEAQLDSAIDALLKQLDLSGKSDYEKIWTVYRYIVDHVTYDQEHVNDLEYKLQQTAYAALVNGTAVCQGYATLLYRLLLALGVDNRVMTGDAGGPHAWNIVELDDTWYYADATWDDPIIYGNYTLEYYSYFLVGKESFTDHTPEEKYNTAQFRAEYPLSNTDYALFVGPNGSDGFWTLQNDGTLQIAGNGPMIFNSLWDTIQNYIYGVVIGDGITTVINYAFYMYPFLETVSIPASVTYVGGGSFAYCPSLMEVTFYGDAPEINSVAFFGSEATVYYPQGNDTWTEAVRQNYGGSLIWQEKDLSQGKWVKENGQWTYYENNKQVFSKWVKDGDLWCYIGADGYQVFDKWVKDGKYWCYIGSDGYMVTDKWVKDGKYWCYIGADGYMVTNDWVPDGNNWCYMDKNGYQVFNKWVKDGKYWCYIGSNGYMVTNKWVKDGSKWCYIGANGYMATNKWVKDGSKWCYVDKNGYQVFKKWVKDGSHWCYIGSNGYMVTNNWAKDGSNWCYMDKNGYQVFNKWVKDGKYWAYIGSDGYMATNQWIKDGSSWAYVDADGHALTGTHVIDGKTYTFDENGTLIGKR